jgi:hypothetical protein
MFKAALSHRAVSYGVYDGCGNVGNYENPATHGSMGGASGHDDAQSCSRRRLRKPAVPKQTKTAMKKNEDAEIPLPENYWRRTGVVELRMQLSCAERRALHSPVGELGWGADETSDSRDCSSLSW